MAELTRAVSRRMTPPSVTEEYPLGEAHTVYDGALMCFGGAGKLSKPGNGLVFAGVVLADTMYEDAKVDDKIRVAMDNLVWCTFSGAAQTDIGELFYASDNGTVTKTKGSLKAMGQCIQFRTGEVRIDTSKRETS